MNSHNEFSNSKTRQGESRFGAHSRDQRTDQLIKRIGALENIVRSIPELERTIETLRRRLSVLERKTGV